MARLPSFIVCGAQRAGTTALHHYLRSHPQVYMPKAKETHFFDKHYWRGLEWYARFFKDAGEEHVAVGEATPSYMYIEEAALRIKRILPRVKLVVLLRHPVDRAYSHYWLEVRLGAEHLSFEEALIQEPRRLAEGSLYNRLHYSYLDRGRYHVQLERLMKLFPRENIFIATHREFREDPRALLKRLSRFLGIDPGYWEEGLAPRPYNVGRSPHSWLLHRGLVPLASKLSLDNPPTRLLRTILMAAATRPGYPPMRPRTRRMLLQHYEEWNRRLEKLTGMRLDWWYE